MKLKLFDYGRIKPRTYQESIAQVALQKNTLCVMPTGVGKTLVAIMVGCARLERYPESRIAILAPTRPLNDQHAKSFAEFTRISKDSIRLITGKMRPPKRKEAYAQAKVIAATPQCIINDLHAKRLSLKDFSFMVFDECHRAVLDYPYVEIAKKYMVEAEHPLILGLTASPGGTYGRIDEICKNLFIQAVEIRSESDEDLQRYVMPVQQEWVHVELPKDFQRVRQLFQACLDEDVKWLVEKKFLHQLKPSKKQLLSLQNELGSKYMAGSRSYALIWAMMRAAQAVKVEHALELLETQGIPSLYEYLQKLARSQKKTDKRLLNDPRMREALSMVERLKLAGVTHPKLQKLRYVIKDLVRKNPTAKLIVFANYRSTVDVINRFLGEDGISCEILIGQALKEGRGLSQDEQIKILRRFNEGQFNALIASSIGEEGLSISDVDAVIFYDSVASEIRKIQRRGRTGRTAPGKIIFLITKGTRDEAYYWAAFHREKRMKGILYRMRKKGRKREKTLLEWLKGG